MEKSNRSTTFNMELFIKKLIGKIFGIYCSKCIENQLPLVV